MKVLADTTVLIAMAQLGQFQLLRALFGTVLIPDAVWEEVKKDPGAAALDEAARADWCERIVVTAPPPQWRSILGRGERAVITQGFAWIQEGADVLLLLDERRARKEAQRLGLRRIGTIGLLLEAHRGGHLPVLRPIMEQLKQTDFLISRALVDAVLEAAGEAKTPADAGEEK